MNTRVIETETAQGGEGPKAGHITVVHGHVSPLNYTSSMSTKSLLASWMSRVYWIAAGIGFVGLVMFVWGHNYESTISIAGLTKEIGGLLLVSAMISLITEAFTKRGLLKEILNKLELKQNLDDAGVSRVHTVFGEVKIWDELFESSKDVLLYISYANTWRNSQMAAIDKYCQDPKRTLTVIFPVTSGPMFNSMAAQYNMSSADLKKKVSEAIKAYKQLGERKLATVKILQVKSPQPYAAYLFGKRAIVTMYNTRDTRHHEIPVFEVEGGDLGRFFKEDLEALKARATQIYPEKVKN